MSTNISINNFKSAVFQPTWPKAMEPSLCKKICTFVWNLFSLIVFPIGLVRLANHYIIRPLVMHFLILPALIRNETITQGEPVSAWMGSKKVMGKGVHIPLPNGKKITGVFVEGEKYPEKLVIVVGGNFALPRDTIEHCGVALEGHSILIINPMGVGGSEGFPGRNGLDLEESLGLPVYSAYEYARECLNFSFDNIQLYGFSLGGVQATLGAAHIQEQYGNKAVKIVNDRSLSSTTDYAFAWAKMIKAHLEENADVLNGVLKILAYMIPTWLISLVIHIAMGVFGLRVDAKRAWLKLKTTEKHILYTKEDEIIPYKASLYKGVRHKSEGSAMHLDRFTHGTSYKKSAPFTKAVRKRIKEMFGAKS